MTKRSVISVRQLFVLFFISRMIVNLTYNPHMAHSNNMWDHVLSAAISFFATLIIALPVYTLIKNQASLDIADHAFFILGKLGAAVVAVYALYYLFVCVYTLSLFNSFMLNVMSPHISLVALSGAVVLTAGYGAYKGIEAIARTAGILFILMAVSVVFIIIALLPRIRAVNYPPFLYEGSRQMFYGVLLMVAKSSCIPALAMILPLAKGNVKAGILSWNAGVYLTIAAMLTVMVGSMGDYLKTQLFPVYTAASVAEIGMLKRLDALYLGVWITGLFLKVSLFLFLFSLCIQKIWGKKAAKTTIFFGAIFIMILSILTTEIRALSRVVYDLRVTLAATLLTAFVIPLAACVYYALKNGRSQRENEG